MRSVPLRAGGPIHRNGFSPASPCWSTRLFDAGVAVAEGKGVGAVLEALACGPRIGRDDEPGACAEPGNGGEASAGPAAANPSCVGAIDGAAPCSSEGMGGAELRTGDATSEGPVRDEDQRKAPVTAAAAASAPAAATTRQTDGMGGGGADAPEAVVSARPIAMPDAVVAAGVTGGALDPRGGGFEEWMTTRAGGTLHETARPAAAG
jgi:hypothetical protein